MERIEELREIWEKSYKCLVNDLSDRLTLEEIACIFFELGWRAASVWVCESFIEKEDDYYDRGKFLKGYFEDVSEAVEDLRKEIRKAMEEELWERCIVKELG